MKASRVNELNIFLMLVALGAAFAFPVELFVLAYAVLGPLHYLTEISWLEKRDYFLPGRKQTYMFFALSLVTTATLLVPRYYFPSLPFIALSLAVLLVFPARRLLTLPLLGLAGLLYAFGVGPVESLVLLLPTLVHVCVFTLVFVLVGAMREKSASALLSLVTYLACIAALVHFSFRVASGATVPAMLAANQAIAPYIIAPLMKLFHLRETAGAALLCQRVIAFSYFYHYLNWFSKTRVIQWHKVSGLQLTVILMVYALNLVFYYENFYLGFLMSYLLSIGHVYLEFPLNLRSMREVFARV